jgi:endonuclease-8
VPEGHIIHRLAAENRKAFGDRPVAVSSPQGRFADEAKVIDGQLITGAEATGKHLFLGFEEGAWVHIHLGLYGVSPSAPAPRPTRSGWSGCGWPTTTATPTCAAPTPAS